MIKGFLLMVRDLTVELSADNTAVPILKDVSFDIFPSSICSLVGGSGSGKTTAAMAILGLLSPGLDIKNGKVFFNNTDLFSLSAEERRQARGKNIGMIFQEPLTAFNPVFTIQDQIEEVLIYYTALKGSARASRVLELLNMTGIDDPRRIAASFPHQLSGGLRQRAMIAQAIAAQPRLLIADEPTSNLDVTLQAKIMELFKKLQKELSLSILLITHDLGMVAHISDEIIVMKDGRVVEKGPAEKVIGHPAHQYTEQLIKAI